MTEKFETMDLSLEAADWFLRLQGEPDSDELIECFATWLQTSAAHQTAWHQICQTWNTLGVLEVSSTASDTHAALPFKSRPLSDSSRKNRSPMRLRPRRWVRGVGAAAFAVAAMLVILALPDIMLLMRADYITQTAETRLIELEDGSRVLMSADSAIATDLTQGLRTVRLLSGRAYFDVTKDIDRPFVVEAGDTSITVLGTAFDVRFSESSTSVELARGAVNVSVLQNNTQTNIALVPNEALYLSNRDEQFIKRDIAQEDIGAWREGSIFVRDEPISAVVEELQRYHGAWITIASPHLARQRVTGLFDLENPDAALVALVRPFGGKVRSLTNNIRVLSNY